MTSIRNLLDEILRNPLVSADNKARAGFLHARLFGSYEHVGSIFDRLFGDGARR